MHRRPSEPPGPFADVGFPLSVETGLSWKHQGWLTWMVALATMAIIWWPLRFSLGALASVTTRLPGLGAPIELASIMRDGIANVLIFLPFGIIAGRRSRCGIRDVTLVALVLGAVLEIGQIFQPERIVSPLDVLANAGGGGAGAWLARVWSPSLHRVADLRGSPYFAIAGMLAAGSLASLLQHPFAEVTGWVSMPVQVGNESTGDRPWCGTIDDLVIEVDGRSWHAEDLQLRRRGPVSGGDCGGWQQNVQPPVELLDAVLASGTFGIALRATPSAVEQSGPARIFSWSLDNRNRNLTIGQEGPDLIVRIRRRWGGANGARPSFRVVDVFAPGLPVQIRVRASSAETVITAGARTVRHVHDVAEGWWILLIHSNEARAGPSSLLSAAAFWFVLLGPFGALLAAGATRRGWDWRIVAVGAAAAGVIAVAVAQIAPSLGSMLAAMSATTSGVVVGRATMSRPHHSSRRGATPTTEARIV